MLSQETPVRCACITGFGSDTGSTVLCDTVPLGVLGGRVQADGSGGHLRLGAEEAAHLCGSQ